MLLLPSSADACQLSLLLLLLSPSCLQVFMTPMPLPRLMAACFSCRSLFC
jgi:hypothetical protein